jgi:hypothetical protein
MASQTINFSDLTDTSNGAGIPIPNGYAGFDWSSGTYLNLSIKFS